LWKELVSLSISSLESGCFSSMMSKYRISQKAQLRIAKRTVKSRFLWISLNLIKFVSTKIQICLKNYLRELKSKSSHISAVQSSYIFIWRKSNYYFKNSWYLLIPAISYFRLKLEAAISTPTADFHFSWIIYESKKTFKSA
jgi:hypothetical protein